MRVDDLMEVKCMPFVISEEGNYYLLEEEAEQDDGTWKAEAVKGDDELECEDGYGCAPIYRVWFRREYVPDENDCVFEYANFVCAEQTTYGWRFNMD